MEEKDINTVQEQNTAESAAEKKYPLAPGEKVFAVVLLATGLAALGLALELWFRMSAPRISSAAAMPLFVSALWSLMALLNVIENFKLKTPLSGKKGAEKVWEGLRYAMPKDVVVMLVAVLAYCVALLMGLSFYIATSLFLYGTMCYLTRKNYLKNVLWTALVMAFIVVVFRMLFSVVFP